MLLISCLIIVALVASSGCANVRPYAEVGLAYQLDDRSTRVVRRESKYQCDRGLQGQFELGLKIKEEVLGENNHLRMGYHHESWVNCGSPFNEKPEISKDDVRLVYHYEF